MTGLSCARACTAGRFLVDALRDGAESSSDSSLSNRRPVGVDGSLGIGEPVAMASCFARTRCKSSFKERPWRSSSSSEEVFTSCITRR